MSQKISKELSPERSREISSQTPRGLSWMERPQRPSLGFNLPGRMIVVPLDGGALALISPLALSADQIETLRGQGEVRYLVAPNLLHHLHLSAAQRAFPQAQIVAPRWLDRKRPDLQVAATLDALPVPLADHLEAYPLRGVPSFSEYALLHRESATLILTDLVFNVRAPRGLGTRLVLGLVGCRDRFAISRTWRLAAHDKVALLQSLEFLPRLPFERLIPVHGEIVQSGGPTLLLSAIRERFGSLLPALEEPNPDP